MMRHLYLSLLLSLATFPAFGQYGFSVSAEAPIAGTRLDDGTFMGAMITSNDLKILKLDAAGTVTDAQVISVPGTWFETVGELKRIDTESILLTGMIRDSAAYALRNFLMKLNTATLAGEWVITPVLSNYTPNPSVRVEADAIYTTFTDFYFSRIEKRDLNLNPLYCDTILLDTLGKNPSMGMHVHDTCVVIIAKNQNELGVFRLSTDGDFIDCMNFDEPGYTRMYDVTSLPGGDILMAGLRGMTFGSSYVAVLTRMTQAGTVVWSTEMNSTPLSRFTRVHVLPDGRIAAFGLTYTDEYSSNFNAVCLFDADGNLQRSIHFGPSLSSHITYSTLEMLPDGFLMGGITGTAPMYDYPFTFCDFSFSQICDQQEFTANAATHSMGTVQHYTLGEITFSSGPSFPKQPAPAFASAFGTSTSVLCTPVLSASTPAATSSLLSPNPVQQGEWVTLGDGSQRAMHWRVLDLKGREVMAQQGSHRLSTQALSPGMYLVLATDAAGKLHQHKLVVR